jgi:hypothetical protein
MLVGTPSKNRRLYCGGLAVEKLVKKKCINIIIYSNNSTNFDALPLQHNQKRDSVANLQQKHLHNLRYWAAWRKIYLLTCE